ncbi:50S ribosomal protein L11 methyltransferase [Phaeobacter sp.]|uniref:50S ribosomal protein L11 methyltransferase n=1 Tax=Phaeobacter sp. TaxID=1902409 RepID=UPI0025EC5497|nr:50S ribosomal protein L11 methyltransferase [Phaeobacter sp.]
MLETQSPVTDATNALIAGATPPSETADQLVARAKSASLADGGLQTSELLEAALAQDPLHHEAQILRERLYQTFVPRWHFPMLADQARNEAYAAAIAAKVRPGDIVLDIGCGAGLTAMLAARAGARHVYTCEQQPLIAQAARQVIADNGLSDRITVINKWSHDIVLGQDMPGPADVVISEIVDTVLLGEGALATLTHAMAALAKPAARAIPESGRLLAQPIEAPHLAQQWQPPVAEGFDLRAFHRFANVAQLTPGEFEASPPRSLGLGQPLFTFDFTRPSIEPAAKAATLTCNMPGTAHAVLVTFDMQLAPGISVNNSIASDGHWGRTAFLLDSPRRVTPGAELAVLAQHDAAELSLTIAPAPAETTAEAALPAQPGLAEPGAVWLAPQWSVPAHEQDAALSQDTTEPQDTADFWTPTAPPPHGLPPAAVH